MSARSEAVPPNPSESPRCLVWWCHSSSLLRLKTLVPSVLRIMVTYHKSSLFSFREEPPRKGGRWPKMNASVPSPLAAFSRIDSQTKRKEGQLLFGCLGSSCGIGIIPFLCARGRGRGRGLINEAWFPNARTEALRLIAAASLWSHYDVQLFARASFLRLVILIPHCCRGFSEQLDIGLSEGWLMDAV